MRNSRKEWISHGGFGSNLWDWLCRVVLWILAHDSKWCPKNGEENNRCQNWSGQQSAFWMIPMRSFSNGEAIHVVQHEYSIGFTRKQIESRTAETHMQSWKQTKADCKHQTIQQLAVTLEESMLIFITWIGQLHHEYSIRQVLTFTQQFTFLMNYHTRANDTSI